MIHIVYLSRAVHPLSDHELQALLAECRDNNVRHDVTGLLFYSHGNIAQLIEGEADVLHSLFEKIARDGRHSHVRKLVDKPIAARSFAGWAMAFHPLETVGFEALAGFLLPQALPPVPASLAVADALVVDLVRLAVFGTGALPTESAPPHA
jgi:hypothetical protein